MGGLAIILAVPLGTIPINARGGTLAMWVKKGKTLGFDRHRSRAGGELVGTAQGVRTPVTREKVGCSDR